MVGECWRCILSDRCIYILDDDEAHEVVAAAGIHVDDFFFVEVKNIQSSNRLKRCSSRPISGANRRTMRLENWFICSRDDAQVARQSGFVVTSSLVESLHQYCQHVTGHESAVLSGGLRTAAHAAEKPTHCALCHDEACPTTDCIGFVPISGIFVNGPAP